MSEQITYDIKAIIGLGNPGHEYYYNRHSIGFRVVDALARDLGATWRERDKMLLAEVMINNKKVLLIKPQTFMNSSGNVIPFLSKQGIKAENILVVHDELEQPFGKTSLKVGGSARGHNGLRSIIAACGENFVRVRFGVGRPESKEQVPTYVLQNFSEDAAIIEHALDQAVVMIISMF
jgi:PTH1 family peptidyl-tRNA hydrolase